MNTVYHLLSQLDAQIYGLDSAVDQLYDDYKPAIVKKAMDHIANGPIDVALHHTESPLAEQLARSLAALSLIEHRLKMIRGACDL
jgi:hypothetical protein